ncbi:amino acid ABC transporter permease, partial [Paenibacillus sp. 28ISP30-2]|nr:amino acid ABC transporter permease [Paenibacillus sp. 28ISP30-2]
MLELMWENVPFLLKGAYYTLYITIVSMLFGLMIGLVVAVARLKGNRPVRWLARSYVSIIRGTPVLVQIAVIYYGLDDYGISFGSLTAACL